MTQKEFLDVINKGSVTFYGNVGVIPDVLRSKKTGKFELFSRDGEEVSRYRHLSEIQAQESDVCFLSGKATKALLYGFPTHSSYVALHLGLSIGSFIMLIGLIRRWLFLKSIKLDGIIELTSSSKKRKWLLIRNKSFRRSKRHLSLSTEVGVEGFLKYLKEKNIKYVALRFFDDLPNVTREKGDLDILVSDEDEEKVRKFLKENSGPISIDLFSASGLAGNQLPYYPPPLAKKIISSAVDGPALSKVPDTHEYFLSLAYHTVYHKGFASGVPSALAVGHNAFNADNNKYIKKLSALAEKLGISVDMTLEGIEEYLAKFGWRPQTDTLFKISQRNEWVRKKFFGYASKKDPEMGLCVFILRQGAIRHGIDRQIIDELSSRENLEVLAIKKFGKEELEHVSANIRGGNWVGRADKAKDLLPSMAIAVLDMHILTHSKAGLARLDFEKRVRDLKKSIRNQFDVGGTSLVHTTDNTHESWEYIEVCFPEGVKDIRQAVNVLYNENRLSFFPRVVLYFKHIPDMVTYELKELKTKIRGLIIKLLDN